MGSRQKTEILLNTLRKQALLWLPGQRRFRTPLQGFILSRFDNCTKPGQCLHYLIAIVIQGDKLAFYGKREIRYGTGQYVVLCNDMPGVS